MNARKFQKQLQRHITTRNITEGYIKSLYANDKKSIFFNKSISELIKENLEILIKNTSIYSISEVINELCLHDDMKQFITNNLDKILINESIIIGVLKKLKFLIISNEIKEYVSNNIESLIETDARESIFLIASSCEFLNLSKDNKEKLDKYLKKHKENYVRYLLSFSNDILMRPSKSEETAFYFLLSRMIEEILEHEKLSYSDIKSMMRSIYSNTIEIGSKIIKLHLGKNNYAIPDNNRIIRPIIRFDLKKISTYPVVVEVIEKVNTSIKINSKQMYEMYKSLREEKIIISDFKPWNIGILLKDNRIYWHKEICLDKANRGIVGEIKESPLKKGNLVITDSSSLCYEGSDHIELSGLSMSFESKYQKEQRQKVLRK